MRFLKICNAFPAILLAMALSLPTASLALPKKGQPAPPFQVVSTAGQKISLANYKGHVLVIEFFATWCGGCKEWIPHLMNLQRQYGGQGLQILGLDVGQGDGFADVKDFAAKKRITYPVALADEDVVFNGYGILRIPTLFVINKNGILVEKLDGFNDDLRKSLEATVKRLLAE